MKGDADSIVIGKLGEMIEKILMFSLHKSLRKALGCFQPKAQAMQILATLKAAVSH